MSAINYRIRMGLAGLWAGIVTLLVFFISLITWGSTFSGWLYARMLGGLGMPILGIKVRVSGKENLPVEPSVILANHQSNLDAFFLGSIFPKNTVVLAKKQMMKVPLFGLILKASRTVLVDREDAAGARKSIQDSNRALKQDRKHLWIFPEGTRSKGKGLGESAEKDTQKRHARGESSPGNFNEGSSHTKCRRTCRSGKRIIQERNQQFLIIQYSSCLLAYS